MSGLTEGIPFSEYLTLPGLSISRLKMLRQSAMKFKHSLTAPHTETAAMALGTAVHTAILEPGRLDDAYVTWEGGTRRGKAWDEFLASAYPKRILTGDELAQVIAMRDSVRCYGPAVPYLATGQAEITMQWTDEESGRECRGRIDWLTEVDGEPVIVDLKTTRSVNPFVFGSQAAKLGYHLQMAYYQDGFRAITGLTPRTVIIAVESEAPYEPAVFNIPEDPIMQGREEYRTLLTRLGECERLNYWPPARESESDLSLPSWAYGGEDDDLSSLGLIA